MTFAHSRKGASSAPRCRAAYEIPEDAPRRRRASRDWTPETEAGALCASCGAPTPGEDLSSVGPRLAAVLDVEPGAFVCSGCRS